MITFSPGWGSGVSGAFTADVELFVLDGAVAVGRSVLERHDYVSIPGEGVFGGIRAMVEGRALLMTAAPLRYDTASGGRAAELEISHAADLAWEPASEAPGWFAKRLTRSGSVELCGILEWTAGEGWVGHDVSEEMFVLEGAVSVSELTEGGPVVPEYGPAGYAWRPAGALHAGPGSVCPDTALALVRRPDGPGATDAVSGPPALGD